MPEKLESYDIVIPTFRNLHTKQGSIDLTLESTRKQSLSPKRIIVVNNGDSDESSCKWLIKVCAKHDAEYIMLPEANRSAARNEGIKRCESEAILFLDDDIIIPKAAMECALPRISNQQFGCGAHRRYISMDEPLEIMRNSLEHSRWDIIDKAANDDQVSENGYRQEFRRFPHQSTFISCFGIIPRWITKAVMFDEAYRGWGLEDTDYMRRLLQHIGFVSLSEICVYHIDHLVSPYKWRDHWGKNFEIYLRGIKESGYLRVFDLLQKDSIDPSDLSNVLLLERQQDDRTINEKIPIQLEDNYKKALIDIVASYSDDPNTAAVMLVGSALRLSTPGDLDIVRITFSGESGFDVHQRYGCNVELHMITIPGLEATLYHPEFLPDTWFWNAGRYVNGAVLFSNTDISHLITSSIESAFKRRGMHFLTNYLGALIRCARTKSLINRLEGLRYAASLLFFWKRIFPEETKYPYTTSSTVRELLSSCYDILADISCNAEQKICEEFNDIIPEIVRRINSESNLKRVYLPDSYIGMQVLKSRGWSDVTGDWTVLQSK